MLASVSPNILEAQIVRANHGLRKFTVQWNPTYPTPKDELRQARIRRLGTTLIFVSVLLIFKNLTHCGEIWKRAK